MADTPAIKLMEDYLAGAGVSAWLVGGTVRDLLRGHDPADIDLATAEAPFTLARDFAEAIGGSYFVLSEEFTACRVVAATGSVFDFQMLRGGDIEADLRERDFTVDAMALTIPGSDGIIDPLGGRADLDAGRLSPVSDAIFTVDPLRLLRAVRLEKTLGLRMKAGLEALARRDAHRANQPAAERRFCELVRILETPGASTAVRRLDGLGLLAELLPELAALKGVTQNDFHHLDVYEHVLAAADAMGGLLEDPSTLFPDTAAAIDARLEEAAAGDASRRQLCSLAALLHDIGKPGCRFADEHERVRFFDHDRLSAELTAAVLKRFRAGSRTVAAVTQLVRQHMRLVALVSGGDISERARLRYLDATAPLTPESILLSVSDRLAVRGPRSTAAEIERHLDFAREMMGRYFAEAGATPLPGLINGDELMRELGLEPGPLVGRLLAAIREEQRLGLVTDREAAVTLARKLVSEAGD